MNMLLLISLVIFFMGCKKDKFTSLLPEQAPGAAANSSIRLFNFFNYNADVTVNNIPLTLYQSITAGSGTASGAQATQLGLSLFPSGIWADGVSFTIPSTLVDKKGNVHIKISPAASTGVNQPPAFSHITAVDTVLHDDPVHPKDYYILYSGEMKIILRNAAAPSQPQNCKVRVINLAPQPDTLGFTGPVTLMFADGTPVSPATTNVKIDTMSDYVELPLGAYQLKLFYNGDYTRHLAELPIIPNFNDCGGVQPPQQDIFPRVRTFKAGATYSIVITRNIVSTPNCSPFLPANLIPVNGYHIITEQSGGTNSTYACMDAASGLNLPAVSILVDGQPLATGLAYGRSVPHKVYVWGSHHVQVLDGENKVLTEKDITMYPNDYLTAWAYINPKGHPDIAFSSTDMTSTLYRTGQNGNLYDGSTNPPTPVSDDGTNGALRVLTGDYAFQTRFLNLSEDVPYVTFGHDYVASSSYTLQDVLFTHMLLGNTVDSANFTSASINLAQGATNAPDPYVLWPINSNGFWYRGDGSFSPAYPLPSIFQSGGTGFPATGIRAYQSEPGPPALVPGTLLTGVPALPFQSFIANPSMYVPAQLPLMEPGFYSVALVGRALGNNASPQEQGRLFYIKHNQ